MQNGNRKLTYTQAVEALGDLGYPIAESTLRHWVSARRVSCFRFAGRTLFDLNQLVSELPVEQVDAVGKSKRQRETVG